MLPPGLPTLKHFILQQQALRLYRYAIRASRALPDPVTRTETLAWIRSEVERNKSFVDVSVIEANLKAIRRDIRRIFPTAR